MEWQGPYLNAGERNVHVWASQMGRNNRPCLVAASSVSPGCWTDGMITVQTFYEWLAEIVVPPLQGAGTYILVAAGNNTIRTPAGQLAMAPTAFNAHVNACRSGPYQQSNSTASLLAGDYLLFLSTNLGCQRAIPVLKTATITSRTITRGQTGSQTPREARSRVTRRLVRERDFRCRVTGVGVPAPRMLSPATRANIGNGDKPENAILMKADVHDQFDDYQFGFWSFNSRNVAQDGQVLRFYRFESSGAPSIGPGVTAAPMLARLGGPATPDPIAELFISHFTTALLWHVAGFGRDRSL
ncbi:hypothetical protein DFH07DRAFT_984486 [Mycena maculata]|uniref:HNH nuclease domain-containing protein n=1 Tax=Mycena maculata TaxID=230809 RepID=A0AAD7MZX3_9AGAR|nr:hypothetical protein DFH07DRAFT_984486 [Mycena maculata]